MQTKDPENDWRRVVYDALQRYCADEHETDEDDGSGGSLSPEISQSTPDKIDFRTLADKDLPFTHVAILCLVAKACGQAGSVSDIWRQGATTVLHTKIAGACLAWCWRCLLPDELEFSWDYRSEPEPGLRMIRGTNTDMRRAALDSEAIDMMIQSGDPIVFLASSLEDLHPAVEMFDTNVVSIGEIDCDVLPVLFALRYPALSDAEIEALASQVPDLSAVALGNLEHLLLAFRQSAPEAIPKMIARFVEPLESPEEEPERKPGQPRSVVPLDDLVGLGAAKPAAQDALAALRDWQAGALAWEDVPRGLLLVGPAGTGKTELARSLAGEAGVHLVTASYNEWQKAGSLSYFLSAMEESFEVARVEAPSILFIDEIDAFYTRHAVSGDGRNDSYDIKAITGFLEKLDGICDREGVIVIGACNHLDLVDPAIRRSGRFDVVAEIGLPTLEELEVILGQHLHDRVSEVDLSACAAAALGRTGADCAAAVRLAGAAARRGKRAISTEDLIAAFDGNAPKLSPDERLRLAVHEAGHAIVASALNAAAVDYVRLAGSGGECKLTAKKVLWTAHDLHISRCVALAGREAERLVFGSLASGSGGTADSDLAQATRSATDQICSYGMGSVGSVWLGAAGSQSSLREAIHGHLPEVAELVHSAEKAANKALALNQDLLIELAQSLSEEKVLYGAGIQAYLTRVSVSEIASTTV